VSPFAHESVLLGNPENSPILQLLRPQPGDSAADLTLGLGGHAEAILERTAPDGILYGFDADAENLSQATDRLSTFGSRFKAIHANFREIASRLPEPVDIVLADLGLSSPHLDDPSRGFSFRTDAPLDMRFDRDAGEPLHAVIPTLNHRELTTILRDFGEVQDAHKIAGAITDLTASAERPLTTFDVRSAVEGRVGHRAASLLPQIFQAFRMFINDEIGALETMLRDTPALLKPGGRWGIISFHSLEDRLVKNAFRALCTPELDELTGQIRVPAAFEPLTKKPVVPDEKEVAENPRSRSAKFRAIRRVG